MPRRNTAIEGVLSVIYQINRQDEPTFASLGQDPEQLIKLYQDLVERQVPQEVVQIQQEMRHLLEEDMEQLRNEVRSAPAIHHDAGQGGGVPPPDKPQEVAPVMTDELSSVPAVSDVTDNEGGQVTAVDIMQMDQSA